jgi:hypothetical protein
MQLGKVLTRVRVGVGLILEKELQVYCHTHYEATGIEERTLIDS